VKTRFIGTAVALLVTLTPATKRAEESLGVLPVADPPGAGTELASATERLREALAARISGVLGPAELRERMAGGPPPSSLAELEHALAGAVAAHAAGEFEASIRTLRAVVDALEALPESAEVFAQWERAMLRLARSEQELGYRAEARVVLERLLRAAPEIRPDARLYPPSFLALVEESRERLRSLGVRRLTVESHPEARVFVEGREVGTSPVSVALPPGRYRVAGRQGGVRVPPVVADLSDGDRVVHLDMSLVEVLQPDGSPGVALAAADRPLRIVTAASRLALDHAVATSLLREGELVHLVATLHDVRSGAVEREGRLRLVGGAPTPEQLEALAAFLATGRASALVSTPSAPSLALDPGTGAAPGMGPLGVGQTRTSRAHGRAAVGTGVATVVAGGMTVYFAQRASSRYDDARSMLDGSGGVRPGLSVLEYNAAISEGDRRRNAAIGTGVAAGVGLAATAILSYVSYRRTGEIGPFRF
jgi:hypothetical protein